MSRVFWSWLLVGLLSSCTSMGRLEKGTTTVSSDESVFILGVSPDGYRVLIFPGSIENGAFKQNPWRSAAFAGHPEDGFVIGKVTAGETLALTSVTAVKDKDTITGTRFGACNGARTMVFNAPATGGKVLYLGQVQYAMSGGRLSVRYGSEIDVAKQHMDKFYPAFSGHVEKWNYDLLPINASCTQTIYVPIYVPSR